MIRWILLGLGIVGLILMALNVALTIGIIERHPFEWLAGSLALCWASTLWAPEPIPFRRREVQG